MEFALLFVLVFFNVFDLVTENPIAHYRFPVTPVDKCPRNAAEFEEASKRKNCTGQTRYLCAPNKYLTSLIEFCTDRKRGLYGTGNCVVLEGTGDLDHYSCVEKFNSSCPKTPYYDDEIYNYTACLEINKDLHCFVADENCQERIPHPAENTTRRDITITVLVLLCVTILIGILFLIMFLYKKRKKDSTAINLDELREFLEKGEMKICHTRGVIVGCAGAGKTTLLKRLQDNPYEEIKNPTSTEIVDVHVNIFEVWEELTTIKVAVKKKNDQPLTITFSKEDMLKVPSERKSELNNDHGNYKENKDNDDSGGSKTERCKENEVVTEPLLPKDTNNKSSTLGTKNAVHTQTQAHAAYGIAEEIEIPSMDTSGTKKEVMSTILDAVRNLSRENRRHPRITFLDFGGQSMYYAFHQIYLSPKTFYILVLDMSKSLDEKVHVTEDTCGGQFESWTYKDYYKFWLRSIDSFSDIHTPVIVIGTHAENKSPKDCKEFFQDFFKIFDGRGDLQRHLHTDRRFAIKFPEKGSKLESLPEIKYCIARLVKALPYWEETIRPACAIFEYILHREKKRKIVSREILSDFNGSLDTEFRLSETEITETLKFLHRVGSLLYFDEEELRNTVILDVQWFVNAFKCIITDSVDVKNVNNKELIQFHKTGELDDEKLVAIWKKPENEKNEYEKHKKEIITYMEHLGLLAICNKKDSSTEENSVWYYFPSMNKRKLGKDLEKLKQYKTSSILCFQFDEEGQFPLFVFYGLVSKCNKVSGWSISEGDTRSIYENVACFTFKSHYVVICICKFQIQVQVCRPTGEISTTILEEVQTAVEKGITEFKKYEYKIGYKCQNGRFCCEEDNSFIALKTFPVFQCLCDKCGVCRQHYVKNKICWREKGQSDTSNNVNLENSHEDTDEGRTSMKRILQSCLDGNVENFLFHLKNEIGCRKHLLLKTDQNGWNVMHFAAKGGNLRIFQLLQSQEIDVCSKTHDQMTVLHIATQSGHYDLCKYILENREFKDNLKSKSALGKNACHFAAESGSVKIFQLLIAEGISPEETTSNGQNVFHIACIYGKVEMCEYISERYVDLIHKESKEGWNAALHAAKNGHTNVLKFLNAKKVSFEHNSESDRNALHIACDNGHFEACEYISENFPSLLSAIDHKGRYASHFAARSGSLEIMKYLESKTKVTQETYIGMNILHMVCLHEHIEMCKYLLERYPDLNVKRTEKGWTTAHFVAGNGNKKGKEIELFEMLLNAERHVDMMLLTVNGNSVLTLAIKYNAYSFANYLFEKCPHLLGIQGAIDPYNTGNEDPKMLALLEKHLGKKPS